MSKFMIELNAFEQTLLIAFSKLVRSGVVFTDEIDVFCAPWAEIPEDSKPHASKDKDGHYYFLAKEIVAVPHYTVPQGQSGGIPHYTVPDGHSEGFEPIEFLDAEGNRLLVVPDMSDIRWLVSVLDQAAESNSKAKAA